jgi:hypothetical protein
MSHSNDDKDEMGTKLKFFRRFEVKSKSNNSDCDNDDGSNSVLYDYYYYCNCYIKLFVIIFIIQFFIMTIQHRQCSFHVYCGQFELCSGHGFSDYSE